MFIKECVYICVHTYIRVRYIIYMAQRIINTYPWSHNPAQGKDDHPF